MFKFATDTYKIYVSMTLLKPRLKMIVILQHWHRKQNYSIWQWNILHSEATIAIPQPKYFSLDWNIYYLCLQCFLHFSQTSTGRLQNVKDSKTETVLEQSCLDRYSKRLWIFEVVETDTQRDYEFWKLSSLRLLNIEVVLA